MAHVHFLKTGFAALLLMTGLLPASLSAQVDLAGNWQRRAHQDWQERVPGPEAVDYLGLPINDAARAKALSYTASILSLPERQCLWYTPQYVVIGPQGFKIWAEFEPATGKVLAWKLAAAPDRAVITIWMDGRPHPSEYSP